jgi:hypothetical protein
MKRFWLSWEETSEDYRPITDPPIRPILAWWCSGEAGDGSYSTLVALVEAESDYAAQLAVLADWPMSAREQKGGRIWRFCNEVDFDWRPGDRFPITKGWSQERIEGRR